MKARAKAYVASATLVTLIACISGLMYFAVSHTQVFTVPVQNENTAGTYKVLDVVDGDTIDVLVQNTKERVRYIGMDTPETVDPEKPPGERTWFVDILQSLI